MQKISKMFFYPVLVFILLMPLLFSKNVMAVFTMPKLFALRLLGAAILIVLAYLLHTKNKPEIFKTRLNLLLILYSFWLTLSTFFSTAFFVSLLGVEGRFIGLITFLNLFLIYFISLNFLGERKSALYFLHAGVASSFITAVIGVYQFSYASFANGLSFIPFFDGKVPFFIWLGGEKWQDLMPRLGAIELSSFRVAIFLNIFMIIAGLIMTYLVYKSFEQNKRKYYAASIFVLVYILSQIFAYNSALAEWSQEPQFRIFSTIGHGNHLGGFLGASLFLTLALSYISNKKYTKILYLLGALISFIAIILTASRGALIGVVFALLVIATILLIKHRSLIFSIFGNKLKKVVFTALALIIIFSGSSYLFWPKIANIPMVYRTTETINFILAGNIPDRLSWWLSSWEMFKDHPIFGIGPETYRNNYNSYRRLDYNVPHGDPYGITPESSHSEPVNVLATQGLLGFLLYYSLIIGSLFLIIRAFLKSKDRVADGILIGFLGSATVYIGQTLISFGVISTLSFFYISLGLGAGFALNQLEYPKKLLALTNKFLVKLALVLTAILLIWFGFIQYQAHYYYSRGIENEYKGKGNEALEYYNKSISALPIHYAAYEKRGDIFLVTAGRQPSLGLINEFLDNAIKSYQASLQYGPKMPHVWGNIAQAYSKMAQVYGLAENQSGIEESLKGARTAAEKSLEFGINNPIFSYSFGEILSDHKLYEESLAYYLQAYNINPMYRQSAFELALAYFELKDYVNSRKFLDAAFIKEPENLDLHRLDTDLKNLGF